MNKKDKATLEQLKVISPTWAKRIKKGDLADEFVTDNIIIAEDEKGREYSLSDFAYCIVGEAHGWKKEYGCGRCAVYSQRLFDAFGNNVEVKNYDERGYTDEESERIINEEKAEAQFFATLRSFVKHWNEEHMK